MQRLDYEVGLQLRMRVQHADGFHARPVRGFNAGCGVFDDEAVLWFYVQALGGGEENIGIRFAALHVGAGDQCFKGAVEVQYVRNRGDVFGRGRRGDGLFPACRLKTLNPFGRAGQQLDALQTR